MNQQAYDCPHCGAGGITPNDEMKCTNCQALLDESCISAASAPVHNANFFKWKLYLSFALLILFWAIPAFDFQEMVGFEPGNKTVLPLLLIGFLLFPVFKFFSWAYFTRTEHGFRCVAISLISIIFYCLAMGRLFLFLHLRTFGNEYDSAMCWAVICSIPELISFSAARWKKAGGFELFFYLLLSSVLIAFAFANISILLHKAGVIKSFEAADTAAGILFLASLPIVLIVGIVLIRKRKLE